MKYLECDETKKNLIKIFYFYEDYLAKDTASAIHISELSNNFPKNFELCCVGPKSEVSLNNKLNLFMILKAENSTLIKVIKYILNEFLCFNNLFILLYWHKPKLILSRSGFLVSPYILGKLFKIPIVSERNGFLKAEQNLLHPYKIFNIITKFSENLALSLSEKIISVSEELSILTAKQYKINLNKFINIPNGVNTELFTILDPTICKKKVGLNNDCRYVCFIGNFSHWHCLEYLVKAAPLVLDHLSDVKFILIGEGITKNVIVDMVKEYGIENNFIFLNRRPYNEIPVYINACDVCVILKRKDIPGSPLKLKEYMACGKPVIATNSRDFRVLTESSAGILVDYEDVAELSEAILTLLQNRKFCETLGMNGRIFVSDHYSWKKIADKVATVCLDAIDAHDNSGRV